MTSSWAKGISHAGVEAAQRSPKRFAIAAGRCCAVELRGVVAAGHTLGLRQLVSLENGPTPESRAAFYGQSVTLAGLLLERGTPQQLIQFVEAGQRDGHDKALRDVYGVESWSTLESEWRSFAASQRLRKLAQHSLPEAKSDQRLSLTERKRAVMAD